jgi:hypothetical protein
MSLEIYINGLEVETNEDTKLAETKQVNDFFEIKDRQTSRTNSFTIPPTPRNTAIFEMLGIVGSTTLFPYRIARIDVKRHGITTIENGRAIIKETEYGKAYNIHSYDGIIDLYGFIENKKLSELDFSDITVQEINQDSWLASLNNTWQDGFIFALADYGNIEDVVEINYQVPSLFVKYLWNKIFSEAGYTFEYVGENNVFESPEFQESILSITEGYSNETDEEPEVLKLDLSKSGSFTPPETTIPRGSGNLLNDSTISSSTIHYIRFNEHQDPDNLHITSTSETYNRSRIRIKESGYYKLEVLCQISSYNSSGSLTIERNGTNLFLNSWSSSKTIDQVKYIYLKENDELFFRFTANYQDQYSSLNYDIAFMMYLDNSAIVLNFNQYYTEVGQKDFIKDVIHHYGLMFQRKGKVYQFISIEDLLTNQGNQEDWSSKFDSAISEEYRIGNYGQKNLLKYTYEDEADNFADASFRIDDLTLNPEQDILTRAFKAPAYSTKRLNNRLLRAVPLWEKSVDDLGNVKEIRPKKSKPFLMRLERSAGSISYKFYEDGEVQDFTGDIPYGGFTGLDHNNIIANRYSAFANLLDKGKKIKVRLYLTELDIYALNFLRLKYIKQLGQLFYLNKVENFQNKKRTTCELIQVRRFINRGEYNGDYNSDYNI